MCVLRQKCISALGLVLSESVALAAKGHRNIWPRKFGAIFCILCRLTLIVLYYYHIKLISTFGVVVIVVVLLLLLLLLLLSYCCCCLVVVVVIIVVLSQLTQMSRSKDQTAEDNRNNYILQLESTNDFRRNHYTQKMPSLMDVSTVQNIVALCM